jgi:drug/metabolite transporter (DMT)-like permease
MKISNIQNILNRIPSSIYLAIAVLIFASSNSLTRILNDIGLHNLIDGRNPISLCNVLFVGNICGLGLMIPLFYHDWNPTILKSLTRKDWISLTITSIFTGAIAPALTFTAIGNTNIANVVLIGRIEPILTLVLSVWLLGLRIDGWTIAGSLASFAGVVVAVLLGGAGKMMTMAGFQIGTGEIFVAIAAVITSISSVNNKLQLQSIPLGIFTIYRNLLGTVTFFIIANIVYGKEHFADAFSPLLWRWMLLYALVIVVIARLCWLAGLKRATPTELNLATLVNPILTIFMAYLILGQVPTLAQYYGLSLLTIGVILSFIGNLHQEKIKRQAPKPTDIERMDTPIGFRGV